ncbi:MAG: bifunctional aspartate kinase/diaminopimelate decarboxylase [Proteobacteria bacterium]|nr:bifunctional aspartate kinase/diaminopimelate decarboxylase [Pseudomonadota bacterium]
MQQIVTKFGGTSVSSFKNWNNIVAITKEHIAKGLQPVIVCSALTDASNKLEKSIETALYNEHQAIEEELRQGYINLAESLQVPFTLIEKDFEQLKLWLTGIALLKEAPAKIKAQILSLGELMMTKLGHAFLEASGVSCHWFDVRSALISTPITGSDDLNYLSARCHSEPNPELSAQFLETGKAAIITQGFFAANPHGETVLLGRGGSDTSAALLAAILSASECEIWTDVAGIYTANPHQLPNARLLKQLNYDEAQEIASMGAKVLQPNSIQPVQKAGIPMVVKYTAYPAHSGTRICKDVDDKAPPIKSIQVKHEIILYSIDTLHMWQQVGFLAEVFAAFKARGVSVDLLSSSQFNVTLSLDTNVKIYKQSILDDLLADLNEFGRAKIIRQCSSVSLVGHQIRTVLPQLGPVLEVLDSKKIYLMSLASNDLNLTFVVDSNDAEKLGRSLHELLIENNPQSFYYSKSWQEEFGLTIEKKSSWWEQEQASLLRLAENNSPCYVYHKPTVVAKAQELQALKSIDTLFYAIKANPNAAVLMSLYEMGIGFECVSQEELEHVLTLFPDINREKLLFTPNFASKKEYEKALELGCYLTIDSLYPLDKWGDLFRHKSILLRIDPGSGAGHHRHVYTGGNESKFGIPKEDLSLAEELIKRYEINVIGLHSHSGSGILSPELWQQTAQTLVQLAERFPSVKIINLGGGLGIADKPTQQELDLKILDDALMAVKNSLHDIQFWLEPGRFFVAQSGVILAKITQHKKKGKQRFVGIETGMNSLLRPSLYGAYHEIVNLSRIHQDKIELAHIVGPICETGDTLGYDRFLPESAEGDIMLIANVGAYGYVMSSNYNLRAPAKELILD